MADEEVLLERDRVKITTTKAQIYGTTYPMNGITSVRTASKTDSPLGAVILLVLGLGAIFVALSMAGVAFNEEALQETRELARAIALPAGGIGIICAIMGVVGFRQIGTRYLVLLGTAGGDRQALSTRDRGFADEVRQALEDAITRRG